MKLWLCRSVCTSRSERDGSKRDSRDAPLVPANPPNVEASAVGVASPPLISTSALRRSRRRMAFMPGPFDVVLGRAFRRREPVYLLVAHRGGGPPRSMAEGRL